MRHDGYGVDVDGQRALDAAAAALAHGPPVLERVAHKGVGRDRSDGLVEVLYLDRRERHLGYVSVGAVFAHGDPVARAEHVVCRELHARNKPEDRILEYEHQYGGRGSQTREYGRGVLVDEYADNDDYADGGGDEVDHLVYALQRTVAQRLVLRGDVL